MASALETGFPPLYPVVESTCDGGKGTMTVRDLETAVMFLRRVVAGQMETDLLVRTVEALEAEIEKRRKRK